MQRGGGISASAQTAPVVVRERVTLAPPAAVRAATAVTPPAGAAAGATAGATAGRCAGPPVSTLRLSGRAGNDGTFSPWAWTAPLAGTVQVTSDCGTTTGSLASAFEVGFQAGGRVFHTPTGVFLEHPLGPTDATALRVQVPDGGVDWSYPFTHPFLSFVTFGCQPGRHDTGACLTSSPHAVPGGAFGLEGAIDGWATGPQWAWPDTVDCGSLTPLPMTLARPDGLEGYVGPGHVLGYRSFSGPFLAFDGALVADAAVPYEAAREGGVAFQAPACAAVAAGAAPASASFWVTNVLSGTPTDAIAVRVAPPTLALTATPDTLGVGQAAALVVQALFADSADAPWPDAAPVTLSAATRYGRLVAGADTAASVTTTYGAARAGGVRFLAEADSSGRGPAETTRVEISAASTDAGGAAIGGAGALWVAAAPRLTLAATPDSVAAGGTSTLAITLQGPVEDVPADATLAFALDAPSLGRLHRADTGERLPALSGVPRSVAEGGGITFEAVESVPPVLARGAPGLAVAGRDSTGAALVWASAHVRAWVEDTPTLADTVTVAVGGGTAVVLAIVCAPDGRTCTIRATLPDLSACGGAYPDFVLTATGGQGALVDAQGGRTPFVGSPPAATLTVSAADLLAGVVFELDPAATGTAPLDVHAEAAAVIRDCAGTPVLPGETTAEVDYDLQRRLQLVVSVAPTTIRMGETVQISPQVVDAAGTPVAVDAAAPVTIALTPPDASTWGQLQSGPTPISPPFLWGGVYEGLNYEASGERPAGDRQITVSVGVVVDGQLVQGQATFTLEVPAVELRLLSQDNRVHVGRPEAGGLVLPSPFRTDRGFRATLSFDEGTAAVHPDPFRSAADGDLYMLRPEVVGVAPGASVEFRVQAGAASSAYDAVLDTAPSGLTAARSRRAFRLVTNETDDRYDPDLSAGTPDQTLRVALGDALRVEAWVDGQLADALGYTVGQGVSETTNQTVYEPLQATLNWRWAREPQSITVAERRASEAWAQAAVQFENRVPLANDPAWGTFSERAILNVMEISFEGRALQASRSGTLTISVQKAGEASSKSIAYSYAAGVSLEAFVGGLRALLESQLGVPVAAHPFQAADERSGVFEPAASTRGWHLVVGRARDVSLIGTGRFRAPGVVADRQAISVDDLPLADVASLVHAVRDDVPATIDMVVVADNALYPQAPAGTTASRIWAKGFDDSAQRHGFTNAVVAAHGAVGAGNRHVHDVAHELGHVLFGGGHANEATGVAGVTPLSPDAETHLMSIDRASEGTDAVGARKRLSEGYAEGARSRGLTGPEPVLFPLLPDIPRSASSSVPPASRLHQP